MISSNLKIEMLKNNINQKQMAERLNVSTKTISNKISGRTEFNLQEMYKIKKIFFPEKTIDYLFQSYSQMYNTNKSSA